MTTWQWLAVEEPQGKWNSKRFRGGDDQLQQSMVISQRQSQKTKTEQLASRTEGNAAYAAMNAADQVRAWQEEAKRLYD